MKSLVVIDDEQVVISGMKVILEKMDVDYTIVGSANNSIDGEAIIKETKPDVLITDIRIPSISGLELIKKIKEYSPNTLCILISGYEEFEYAKEAIKLGVVDYISKPITIAKIKKALEICDEIFNNNNRSKDDYISTRLEVLSNCINGVNLDLFEKEFKETIGGLKNFNMNFETYKNEVYKLVCVCLSSYYDSHNISQSDKIFPSIYNLKIINNYEEVFEYSVVFITRIREKIVNYNKGINHVVIVNILEDLARDYNKNMGVNEYAIKYEMSPKYLSTLFKDEVGKNFIKYLTNIRIEKAKEMLLQGNKVGDVSRNVGYNNYRYFTEIFKKTVGMSPNEFRGGRSKGKK